MSYPGRIPELLANNEKFAQSYQKPPMLAQIRQRQTNAGNGLLVLTCLDPRVIPEHFLGPNLGAGVMRNAGGRASDDVIRSITTIRSLANAKTVMVIHHTDCGMTHLTDAQITADARERTPDAGAEIDRMNYGCYTVEDYEKTILEDVATLRSSPSLKGMDVFGFALDVETGVLRGVGESA